MNRNIFLKKSENMKILFIGNSHTFFNDMPHLFAKMCEAKTGEMPETVMLAYSGRTLEWHTKEYFSVRYNLLYGGYDYCVIQQAAHPFPDISETESYGSRLAELCRTVGTKPVFLMTWAEKTKPENQQIMIDTYTTLARENSALLAPVGAIWQQVQQMYLEMELYWRDGAHASVYGDYLIAAVLCKTILGGTLELIGNMGLDFGTGADIDFHNPVLCEKVEEIPQILEKEKCDDIKEIVTEYMEHQA